jgi:ATP-dependent Clp protease ATP-binding subunit ClpA
LTRLELNLNKHLHGQPLAINTLVNALKSHFDASFEKSTYKKALVLSLHGPTGVGKNYASKFIVESLFEKGVRSKFFKHFIASRDFYKNDRIAEYKVFFIKLYLHFV